MPMSDVEDYIYQMNEQSAANSAFNAQQAQLNRDFQERMSNTAHVREVADLQNAGLNPILAANSGASVPNGSSATADDSSAKGYAQLANTALNNITQLAVAQIAASATMSAAETAADASKYGSDMNKIIAEIQQGNTLFGTAWKVWDNFVKTATTTGFKLEYADGFQ